MEREPSGAVSAASLIAEPEPRPEDIRFLEDGLNAFNVETTGIADGNLLGLFARSGDGSPIGGAFGWTWGGACYIRYLFVQADARGRGLGTQIMAAVEKEARSRNCRQIVLETHEFQAPGFYRKLGFVPVGEVAEYPRGHSYITLVKHLA